MTLPDTPPVNHRRALGWTLIGLSIGLLVVGVLWLLVTVLSLTTNINDCLDSRGQCQKLAEKRAGETRDLLIKVEIYSGSCRAQEPAASDDALQRCVALKLRADAQRAARK